MQYATLDKVKIGTQVGTSQHIFRLDIISGIVISKQQQKPLMQSKFLVMQSKFRVSHDCIFSIPTVAAFQ
jgi:hypothetical protein